MENLRLQERAYLTTKFDTAEYSHFDDGLHNKLFGLQVEDLSFLSELEGSAA